MNVADWPSLISHRPLRILTLGDGNLSYSSAVLQQHFYVPRKQRHSRARHVIHTVPLAFYASVYESQAEHQQKYRESAVHSQAIERCGGLALYNVDATDISQTLRRSLQCMIEQHAVSPADAALLQQPHHRAYLPTLAAVQKGDGRQQQTDAAPSPLHLQMCQTIVESLDSVLTARSPDATGHSSSSGRKRAREGDCVKISPSTNSTIGDDHRSEFDLIIFNHPHSGSEDMQRHQQLLCHFFHSALDCIAPEGCMLVSLCDDQPERWKLVQAAERFGFQLHSRTVYDPSELPQWQQRRHHRNKAFTKVIETQHVFVFRLQQSTVAETADDTTTSELHCDICDFTFANADELQQHWSGLQPVDAVKASYPCERCGQAFVRERSLLQHQEHCE